MGSFKLAFQRQNRYIVAIGALLLAVAIPAIVSAAQITGRSIELSNSSKEMTGVQYEIKFTAVGAATGFVVDFCTNSPLIGQTCNAPEGLNVGVATTADATKDAVNTTASKFVGTKAIAAGAQTITLTGVTNPDDAGTIYARILTFNDDGETTYTSAIPGDPVDSGSVAISITDTVGVSGAVLETLTFCVAGDAGTVETNDGISANCGDAATYAPTLKLGEASGGTVALIPTAVSEGDIYAQISTNAVNGAIVRLKSNAVDCGGLLRAGAAEACDIVPSTDDITAGQAEFGLKVAAATDPGTVTPSGVFQARGGSGYNATTFLLNYASNNATGVTSMYGDEILDTNGAPANNKNMKLTFGASISNDTPAGLYSADLSLIATGTF